MNQILFNLGGVYIYELMNSSWHTKARKVRILVEIVREVEKNFGGGAAV
jgi:hypothetical protein